MARIISPRQALEVGSGVGYSALWFMKGMRRKRTLDAIEIDPQVIKELNVVVKRAKLKNPIRIHHGSALATLRKLRGPYDIVFIDAQKNEYPRYLEEAMNLTKVGSIILADNLLWSDGTFMRDFGRKKLKE